MLLGILLYIFWNLYLKRNIFCCFPPPPAMQMIYILMHRSIAMYILNFTRILSSSFILQANIPFPFPYSFSLFFSRNLRNNLNKILKLLPLVTIIMSLPPKLKLMGKQQKMKKNIPVWIRPEIQPNQIFLVILLSATTAMEPLQSPPRSSVVMKASKRELLIWTYPSKPKMKKNSWMCKYFNMENIENN